MSTEKTVVVIAAFTESMKVLLGEIRGLGSEAFLFQLRLMELLPEAERLEAFKVVVEANTAAILSDERIAFALLSAVEKLGAASVQIIPSIVAMRHEEIKARMAQLRADAEERARMEEERAAEREEREALDSMRMSAAKPYLNGLAADMRKVTR